MRNQTAMNHTTKKNKLTRKTGIGVVIKRRPTRAGKPGAAVGGLSPANDVILAGAEDIENTDISVTDPTMPAVVDEISSDELTAETTVASSATDAEADDDDEVEDVEPRADRRSKSDDEPVSFLGMYFRDMAELEVLRPEQEFETAREIESMEIEIWKTILGFVPGASWIADAVDKAVGHPLPELKHFARSQNDHERKHQFRPGLILRRRSPRSRESSAFWT